MIGYLPAVLWRLRYSASRGRAPVELCPATRSVLLVLPAVLMLAERCRAA